MTIKRPANDFEKLKTGCLFRSLDKENSEPALRYQEKIGRVEFIGILVGILSIVLIFWSDLITLIKG